MGAMLSVIVSAMMLLTVVPLCDPSDADSSQGVSDIAVKVYDNTSSYSDLVYMGTDLPDYLNASEWLKDTDGFWYNINSLSSNYGKILTNGMVAGIPDTMVRSDILAKYPVLDADFVILQVTYKLNYGCNVTVSVEKDGVSKYEEGHSVLASVSHYHFGSGMQRAVVLTVKNDPSADIETDSARGNYTVSMSYNGISAGSQSYEYLSSKILAGGTLLDYAGNPINGASVSFGALGSVYSDTSGHFAMYVDYGSVPVIQAITLAGYTFSGLPMSYGTVTSDTNHTFNAAERTLNVTVTDGSGRAVSGVQARGYWYHNDGSGMEIETDGLTTIGVTDSDGNLRIAVNETKRAAMVTAGAKLYVAGVDGTNYTFLTDVMPGPGSSSSVPDPLTEAGNVYADTSTLADVAISTIERSVMVTVRGALDAMSEGGSPLPNAIITAVWYYQTYDGADYTISLLNDIEPGTFIDLVEGYVRIASPYSENDGNVLIVYRTPSWTVGAGETAHIYIRVTGADPTSGTSEYNFTTATITDGDKSIEELTADTAASKAMEMSAITNVTLRADEVAYTVTGTVTGTLPSSFNAFRITPSQLADTFSVGGTGIFTFPVKSGTSNTIELDTVEGYVFSNPTQTMPTAGADQAFTSTCALDTATISRSPAVAVAHYTVTGAEIGTIVSATYRVAGTQVKSDVISDSDTIHVDMYGRDGNIAEDVMITGKSDFYVGPMSGTSASGYKVTSHKLVLYVNAEANVPASDNVVAGTEVQVYCGGTQYAVVTSDAAGIATSNLPDIDALTFKVGEYTATATAMTSGPYTGYIAVNLAGIVDPPAPADVGLTIRYIASASMQNTETPTNIDVMNSPMTVRYAVGTSQTFKAPELTGFEFAGWFLDGQLVSNVRDVTQCTISITAEIDGSELVASYSAENPPQPVPDYGPTIAAGILSVTIALVALLYVIVQKRY